MASTWYSILSMEASSFKSSIEASTGRLEESEERLCELAQEFAHDDECRRTKEDAY
eukprot:CAMPEP_0177647488 /NCGR_PEP_ID=MMETSP0447-20121125/10324_1 /TAXON_ID=0 /ORGANISM="Stygamoeba regulata, Strain BSH-02190019" /LENGTH=55 /DNA_ID=CAMNT_0019150071 /DNA_START=2086 /DNA_END=2253 /DNA_ORIENTATION=-